MRDKKSYLLYPNCGYCVYYMIQYKVISKKYKKEAVFLGKVLEYSPIHVVCYSTYVIHPNGSSISPFWMLTI